MSTLSMIDEVDADYRKRNIPSVHKKRYMAFILPFPLPWEENRRINGTHGQLYVPVNAKSASCVWVGNFNVEGTTKDDLVKNDLEKYFKQSRHGGIVYGIDVTLDPDDETHVMIRNVQQDPSQKQFEKMHLRFRKALLARIWRIQPYTHTKYMSKISNSNKRDGWMSSDWMTFS